MNILTAAATTTVAVTAIVIVVAWWDGEASTINTCTNTYVADRGE